MMPHKIEKLGSLFFRLQFILFGLSLALFFILKNADGFEFLEKTAFIASYCFGLPSILSVLVILLGENE